MAELPRRRGYNARVNDAPRQPAVRSSENDSIKETFESIIIAFVLAFVFRAYVVEAFVIPTGSMAPTLLGEHVHVTCRQCGYRFDADPSDRAGSVIAHRNQAVCPMCHFPNPVEAGSVISSGDRILVHKFIYNFVEPRRWDVVVFKNPQNPSDNFIKRLVGLPSEDLFLIEGNVFTRPSGADDAAWRIARKTRRDHGPVFDEVQRAVWQPVYHSQFIPLDGGRNRLTNPWAVPWAADPAVPAKWLLENRRSYRKQTPGPGAIAFDFTRAQDGLGLFPYNQFKPHAGDINPVEDVRIAAAVEADAPGVSVTLQTTARWLGDPSTPTTITGRVDAQGRASLELTDMPDPLTGNKPWVLRALNVGAFQPGIARNIDLWHVDQQISLWVDGRPILIEEYDLPNLDAYAQRRPLPTGFRPAVRIALDGPPATLHQVNVDRDIYYTPNRYDRGANAGHPGLATMLKIYTDKTRFRVEGRPANLGPDQFFCLGDNSPLSSDGRLWSDVDRWVKHRMLNDPAHPQVGVVPRELMMGRAFFVYFPAPYRLSDKSIGVFPNFADMRFIH